MHEIPITWRHALHYANQAKQLNWKPEKLGANQTTTCTLLLLKPAINIPDIRDWVYSVVGEEYDLSAIFKDGTHHTGASILIPHLLRFKFYEMESAMLFKLTWF